MAKEWFGEKNRKISKELKCIVIMRMAEENPTR
jgi:hypothetical protein